MTYMELEWFDDRLLWNQSALGKNYLKSDCFKDSKKSSFGEKYLELEHFGDGPHEIEWFGQKLLEIELFQGQLEEQLRRKKVLGIGAFWGRTT